MTRILFAAQDYRHTAKAELITCLLAEGYEVVCVEDYTSTMEVLQTQSFQVVMTAPGPSSISALDLLHTVRTLMPGMLLIMLLNFATYRDFSRLIPIRVRFVEGPFDPGNILDTLRIGLQTPDKS